MPELAYLQPSYLPSSQRQQAAARSPVDSSLRLSASWSSGVNAGATGNRFLASSRDARNRSLTDQSLPTNPAGSEDKPSFYFV